MNPDNICDIGPPGCHKPCRHKKICWMIRKAEELMESLHGTGPELAIVSCKFYGEMPEE